jgi:TPP-dependent pyruvate/acetoin dehydrogenase alpha subunit
MITEKILKDFEQEIAEIYATGKITSPVHLRSGREQKLIDIFSQENIGDEDYVFGYWDSHELALLKGIPADELKESIIAGNSIALCFPEKKFLCSGIVGSLMGTATGVAWSLKRNNSSGRVYLFCGEMSSETGIFFEAVKYAVNFDLPVKFIISDNGVSVMTDTREVWGNPEPWFKDTRFESKIIYYKYQNEYPHSGLGRLIKF